MRSLVKEVGKSLVNEGYKDMSRIGSKPIPLPAGVKIQIRPAAVEVQGPKGKMNVPVPRGIRFEQKDGTLIAMRETDEHPRRCTVWRALWSPTPCAA